MNGLLPTTRIRISFRFRRDKSGNEIIALVSFSGAVGVNYYLGVNKKGKYRVAFCSDDAKYGGAGTLKKRVLTAVKQPSHGKEYSLILDMPKFTCLHLVREPDPVKTKIKTKEGTEDDKKAQTVKKTANDKEFIREK